MNHADPWDEMARLESQMDVELLALREDLPLKSSKDLREVERLGDRGRGRRARRS